MVYVESSAVLSEGGKYRYSLARRWGYSKRVFVVIGLNPSTADAEQDDPTIRRCVRFAMRERCEGLVMLNLYALRSTRPEALWHHPDPVGPENDAMLRRWLTDPCATVVAAWGAGDRNGRAKKVVSMVPQDDGLPRLFCLGVTQAGHPRHPLYLPSFTPLVVWSHSLEPQVSLK